MSFRPQSWNPEDTRTLPFLDSSSEAGMTETLGQGGNDFANPQGESW